MYIEKIVRSMFSYIIIISLISLSISGCQKTKEPVIGNKIDQKTTADTKKSESSILSDPFNDEEPKQREWRDIPYATISSSQKLDIYLPKTGIGPFPVIISIHGGGLSEGDKVGPDLKAALNALQRGYAVISMNYRLLGEAKTPAQIQDVKTVIRFVRANASLYALNTQKIALWGGSAGGYLASLAGTSSGVKEFIDARLGNSEQTDKVQAVVDWYGPIRDQKVMGLDPKYTANPETYISKDDPVFLIQHGKKDQLVSYEQSVSFAQELKKVLGENHVVIDIFEKAKHGDPIFFTSVNINKVLDFLDLYLKQASCY